MHLETAEEGRYQPDTADGQTTSPQPSPFTSSIPLDQTPSSVFPSQNPALDCSPSAPASMEQTHAPEHSPQEPPQPSSPAAESSPSPIHPLHSAPDPDVPPLPSPSSEMSCTFIPPADESTASQDLGGEVQPVAAEGDVQSNKVESSSMNATPEELSPSQPMEQEGAKSACPTVPTQSESVEMEMVSDGAASVESDQSDGDRRPSSDCIPSLAAALKELHELLVSNNQAQSQSRSTSCSPPNAPGQDSDRASSEPGTPTPESTAIATGAETRDAKANFTAAVVSDEEPDLPGQEEVHLSEGTAETVEDGLSQCPSGSEERAADDQEETSDISVSESEPEVPTGPALVPDFWEPPEGQPGSGDADGQASGTDIQDSLQTEHIFLTPLSVEVGPPEEVSCTSSSAPLLTQAPQPSSPAPLLQSLHPFTEQFPAEHIQRIQAAGFSAREAVEALERAHGVVEIALLALLARSITVPT
uniref:UBA domain-containing protein n=2 Tax=Iconisemion striatum TaxID=60296 RepID=A0A1A7WJW8_9TELE